MIVVLGSGELAGAVASVSPGELVVGAGDDERLAGPPAEAAQLAAVLPLPARACVIGADRTPAEACLAARRAGGALAQARLIVVGEPPVDTMPLAWRGFVERLGATVARDMVEMSAMLAHTAAIDGRPSAAERRAMRPGAPEAAAWREALRSARPRRRRLRRRNAVARPKIAERTLDAVISRPLAAGCHSIAVISPKGGVGKTLLSFVLGSILAQVRGDRVLAVDTNPDFGTLADLVEVRVPATISDLLRALPEIGSQEDLTSFVTITETGLHILAAPQDPAEMGRLGSGGYLAVNDLLRRHYDLVVYDCGTGFLDEITQFALRRADQAVLVSVPQLVTAKIILGAIDYLALTAFDLRRSTLVLNMVRGDDALDRGRLRSALEHRVGGVVEVPYDSRLQRVIDLGEFRYGKLGAGMRLAVKLLAAELIARFPEARLPGESPPGDGRAASEWQSVFATSR